MRLSDFQSSKSQMVKQRIDLKNQRDRHMMRGVAKFQDRPQLL
jgi:hypothetical protein